MPICIGIAYEEQLLGTCGTLLANQSFFSGSTGLLIHADNATNADIQDLINAHHARPSHCLLTMLTLMQLILKDAGLLKLTKRVL